MTHEIKHLDELPVLINGDDILFSCDRKFYDYWLEEIMSVGFMLSDGKNLVSKKYFSINSVLYRYDSNDDIRCIQYFPLNLMLGA